MSRLFAVGLFAAICASAQTNPVPSEYQGIYDSLSSQISSFDASIRANWSGPAYPVLNAPQLQSASSNQFMKLFTANYYHFNVVPELTELQALGANAVTVHIDFPVLYAPYYVATPQTYSEMVGFYQKLASDVHSRGMKLIVESTVGIPMSDDSAGSFSDYFRSLSWNAYMTGRAQNAVNVAQLIEPDYLTVVTEPDTEAGVSGQTNAGMVSGSTQLVQQTLAGVKAANVKGVLIGAGAGTWMTNSMQFYTSFAGTTCDFVDMHLYPVSGNNLSVAASAAQAIRAAGKKVTMSETWVWKTAANEVGKLGYSQIAARNPFTFWQPIDTAFLNMVSDFASSQQLDFVSPFWTHYFFAGLDYNTYGTQPMATLLGDADQQAALAEQAAKFTPTGVQWEQRIIPAPDTTAPSGPPKPTPTAGTTSVTLNWPASTDNVGTAGYKVYRNGSLIGTTSATTYYDQNLPTGTNFSYKVSAFDAQGNVSAKSQPLNVQTINITPPSVPTNVHVTGTTAQQVSLAWSPSTGVAGVAGYRVLKGTSPSTMRIYAPYVLTTNYVDTGVYPGTPYYYQVEAYVISGVSSAPSAMVTAVTAKH